jgi:hypothetical protein
MRTLAVGSYELDVIEEEAAELGRKGEVSAGVGGSQRAPNLALC